MIDLDAPQSKVEMFQGGDYSEQLNESQGSYKDSRPVNMVTN